ncbi:MAG: hypothetical protein JJU13_10310 [Balneolaceae bacterium]|nr:hypothetical protein [Balneolaceae bacterium]
MKTFEKLQSYKALKKLKETEAGLKARVLEAKNKSSQLKKDLSDRSKEYEQELKNQSSDYQKAGSIQEQIKKIHEGLADISKTINDLNDELADLQGKEIKAAEKAFIKEATPLVDAVISTMKTHAVALDEANQVCKKMIVQQDAVKRESTRSSFFKEDVLPDLPGINKRTERILGIVEYQKKKWQEFKKSQ